jgi:hypothetical protein
MDDTLRGAPSEGQVTDPRVMREVLVTALAVIPRARVSAASAPPTPGPPLDPKPARGNFRSFRYPFGALEKFGGRDRWTQDNSFPPYKGPAANQHALHAWAHLSAHKVRAMLMMPILVM